MRLLSVVFAVVFWLLATPHLILAQDAPKDGQSLPPPVRIANGVSAPKPVYTPNPEYTKAARKAKLQGTVIVQTIVDTDGHTRDTTIVRGLDEGLNENAIKAVNQWTFQPAMKDGQPVPVQINVEVNFRLY